MRDNRRISTAGIALKNDRVLVALRKPGTSIGESWEFPGGKSEEGETPEQTLIREYLEEFDVKIKVLKKICDGSFRNGDKEYLLFGYLISLGSEIFNLKEHSEIQWIDVKDLSSLPMADSDRQIADCLKKIENILSL